MGYCTTATWRVSWDEQPHRPAHDVVEVDRAVEEGRDRALLGRAHRLDRGQPVDEEPVALVGRHPAGAGVRLGDVALVLQRGHVVADGGRRDAEAVPLDERLGARPAPRWRRSPRRSRAARRAAAPPASPPPGIVGSGHAARLALVVLECQSYSAEARRFWTVGWRGAVHRGRRPASGSPATSGSTSTSPWSAAPDGLLVVDTHALGRRRARGDRGRARARRRRGGRRGQHPRALRPHLRQRRPSGRRTARSRSTPTRWPPSRRCRPASGSRRCTTT